MACAGAEPLVTAGRAPWGDTTGEKSHLLLPEALRPDGVLEVFLMGGLCPWDTFYVVPEHGRPDASTAPNSQWWTFQEGEESVEKYFAACDGGQRPLLQPWTTDAAGREVSLGPWLYPLRDRPDILARMRVLVMNHVFEPHDAATPLALTGHPRGTPRMSCTGAHVQRYQREHDATGRVTPYAYTLFSGDSEIEAQFDIHSASASGLHGASARPLEIRLTADNPLPEQLGRAHLGGWHREMDAGAAHYLQRYRAALGGATYAPALGEVEQARRALTFADQLAGVFSADVLAPALGAECGSETLLDTSAMGPRLARGLLTREADRARYVTYIDSGLINASGAGYDTHDYHVRESSRNVVHTMRLLTESINAPGEVDPRKLDLDRHLVLLSTEFGRTPYPEFGKPLGLDHWPFGYVVVLIGGPVRPEQAGVAGAIGPTGNATSGFTPGELRAALLLAQGIWPFASESFAVGDVRNAATEEAAAELLRSSLLGVSG